MTTGLGMFHREGECVCIHTLGTLTPTHTQPASMDGCGGPVPLALVLSKHPQTFNIGRCNDMCGEGHQGTERRDLAFVWSVAAVSHH